MSEEQKHNHTVGYWDDRCGSSGLAIRSSTTGKLINLSDYEVDEWFAFCPDCGEKLERPK